MFKMTLGRIVHLLPQDERKTVRRLEKLAYKINAAETAAIFNETLSIFDIYTANTIKPQINYSLIIFEQYSCNLLRIMTVRC